MIKHLTLLANEGVRLTLLGLKFAQGLREEKTW
jgi:hypothetical protein